MSDLNLLFVICAIGICTYLIRVIFVYYSPELISNHYVSTGLKSVPSSMLIALVLPFLLFENQAFHPFRLDVLAIILTIPVLHYLKKYQYGLVFALGMYGILRFIVSIQ